MASETGSTASSPPMTTAELVELVQHALNDDEEHQAKMSDATPTELPTCTGSTLNLSYKRITTLPVEVVLLIKDKVERLALSHNRLMDLPTEIAQCDRLRYLNLRWNKLEQFPLAVLSLAKLEVLDVSRNKIETLPEEIKKMGNLKYLALANNQVRRLPLALGDMNLIKLRITGNPIEFPPPGALDLTSDNSVPCFGDVEEQNMCQQVKRFMKAAALRERVMNSSEEDLSESNVETPRPPRRGANSGRFPVRPSISGIENISNPKTESPPEHPPPIPVRSHARVASSNYVPPAKRPGITPLLTGGNDNARSLSENPSANLRNRRQGYVPRKNSGLNSYSEMSSQLSARTSQASQVATLTPPHSRTTSAASNYAYLGSGNEASSAAVSPIDTSGGRALLSRKLASLPESRNSRLPTINSIKAVKRVLLTLLNIHQPVEDISQQLRDGTPRRTNLDRQLSEAKTQVQELGRHITRANDIVEDNGELDSLILRDVTRAAVGALQAYGRAVAELNRNRQQTVKQVDAFHIRWMINTAYGTFVEARNVCQILGFKISADNGRNTITASQAWSSRTVTPTQPKSATSANNNRRRGATILPSGGSTTSLRGMAPPVPLNNNSRSNTMASISGMTTRYIDGFPAATSSNTTSSRSNTLRNISDENEREDPLEHAYATVKYVSELAAKQLDLSRAELIARRAEADDCRMLEVARICDQSIAQCDFARSVNKSLLGKLPAVRSADPGHGMELLKQISEEFGNEWHRFVTEIKKLAKVRGLDVSQLRLYLKPVQYAMKDVTRAVAQPIPPAKPPPSASLYGGFPSSLNTALAQNFGQIPPVPATPLGAALGPAVQATLPPTPLTMPVMPHNTTEYFAPGTSRRINPEGTAYPRR